jgi:hypothetical protein
MVLAGPGRKDIDRAYSGPVIQTVDGMATEGLQ